MMFDIRSCAEEHFDLESDRCECGKGNKGVVEICLSALERTGKAGSREVTKSKFKKALRWPTVG